MARYSRSLIKELGDLPKYLYKYFSSSDEKFDRIEQVISESKLYFAQPKSFNDPFDCNIPLSFKATQLKAEKYWKVVARRQDGSSGRQLNQSVRELVALSRTKEGKTFLNNKVRDSVNKNGIASFSTDNRNTLMWAYYASGHTGVSLRFNMSSEYLTQIKWSNLLIQVDYQENIPEINYYEIENPDSYLTRYFGTKAIGWKHENEWRLVSVGEYGLLSIPNKMVDGIIFGLSTDKDFEKRVRQLVEKSKVDIELLRVVHKPGSYELEVEPA